MRNNINHKGIKDLVNLKILYIYNENIIDLNHFINLEELYIGLNYKYNKTEIQNLTKLRILDINCNENITDLNYLINLEKLYCIGSNVNQKRNKKIN